MGESNKRNSRFERFHWILWSLMRQRCRNPFICDIRFKCLGGWQPTASAPAKKSAPTASKADPVPEPSQPPLPNPSAGSTLSSASAASSNGHLAPQTVEATVSEKPKDSSPGMELNLQYPSVFELKLFLILLEETVSV